MERPLASRPAVQRWRLYVAQPAAAVPDGHAGGVRGWAGLLAGSGLPLAGEGGARGRVVVAAPLPLGIAGEREVVDVLLAERLPVAGVREAIREILPSGWTLVGLHDVWLGAPAAPAALVAADYRATVTGRSRPSLEAACRELLAAATLPRERRRDKRTTPYDLRPLVLALAVREASGAGVTLAMRLRHGPDAVGRPEEVVAVLGERPAPPPGEPIRIVEVVRERLVLADDPVASPAPPSGGSGPSPS